MKFNKSYRLIRFLNRDHFAIERYFYAAIAWSAVLLATQSLSLAKASGKEFIRDDFRLSFRRLGWYAQKRSSWLNWFDDPFFNFTEETTPQQRADLVKFLSKSPHNNQGDLTDLLLIKAQDLHESIEAKTPEKNGVPLSESIESFYNMADKILDNCMGLAQPKSPNTKKNRKADFSKANAIEALQDFAHLFPIEQYPWFVISGTFLGLHRENDFLEHDYDIDLGIYSDEVDVSSLLKKSAQSKQFVTKKGINYCSEIQTDAQNSIKICKKPVIIKLIHKNGLNLDLFIHHKENNCCWHGSSVHRWENSLFDLTPGTLAGVKVLKPNNPDQYLTENYGNWKQPVKTFDCTADTNNLVIARNFLSIAIQLKRIIIFAKQNHAKSNQLIQSLTQCKMLKKSKTGKIRIARDYLHSRIES